MLERLEADMASGALGLVSKEIVFLVLWWSLLGTGQLFPVCEVVPEREESPGFPAVII